MEVNLKFDKVILQPTTSCNLNCRYCYLPDRRLNSKMSLNVASKVASDLEPLMSNRINPNPLSVIWHSGEPLVCGIKHFTQLVRPFEDYLTDQKIEHRVQTNATLIDEKWCHFFLDHRFSVGVSIDGPKWANKNRVDWGENQAFGRIMRGIEHLKEAKIPFVVIAVIDPLNVTNPKELYEFFCELGCTSVGFSFEEKEGINQSRDICDGEAVTAFWSQMFKVWLNKPQIGIREFSRTLSWMNNVCVSKHETSENITTRELHTTIGVNGDVFVLSPELAGQQHSLYGEFSIGNVQEDTLQNILARVYEVPYVRDFIEGIRQCYSNCSYFSYCKGGFASNKLWELGHTKGTETKYCLNSKQRLVDSVISVI